MLDFSPQPYDWVAGLGHWGVIMVVAAVAAFVTALFTSVLALGFAGPVEVLMHIIAGVRDLLGTSPRRVLALAKLTFFEAYRRKTLLVFVVFAVLFLFAGWFLSDVTEDAELQVKNYVSFVLRTINWLILPVVLLLSCWGLPEDIRVRSLHTVVTKPVRRHEIVLGRILGFSGIGALVLVVMSVVGYIWINRQLPESMKSQLTARVPIYGTISFIDNEGNDKKEGINVGDENMFRSFIEGNTKSRAIWDFANLDSSRLGEQGLVLESTFQSFRTYKGNIEKELMCQYTLVNPETNVRARLAAFEVHEFRRNVYNVLAENRNALQDEKGNPLDLDKDLIKDGKLRVEVACLSSAQFLGMANPDLFVRLPDQPFYSTYFKSIFNIALMMVMVVVLGVMSGCFLKGPVATMLTAFIVIVGKLAHGFLVSLVTGQVQYNPSLRMEGTGLFDSIYRIPTHTTPSVDLGNSFVFRLIKVLDNVELNGLYVIHFLFPNFGLFDTTEYSANAFDVPWSAALLPSIVTTIGYCIPWILVGYFSLRVRELEAK